MSNELPFPPNDPAAAAETAALDAAFAASSPAAASERPGQRIGRYKLLQQIGEGGMGTVWMAEQTTPVVRRVALKVIKLGMDSRAVVARFEAERQALALMDHPHIARVLDAGTTDNGRPYFAMDLVRGQPATEYADLHGLTIPQRLDLFRQVCSAVQHAHQKGVIHRDLKPANVLVSTEDDRPFAKVIDFGIAKAVGRRLTDLTLFTQHGGMVGTLEYMSPEQADASPDVDTRSDVYSLGVMLYELLTGVTPLGRDRLGKAAFDELRRIIREEEPPRPSTRVTTAAAAGSLADVAKHRRTEPRRLGVLMRGELDWVVMRALEKERGRRYESAGALAEDLRRHAAGEPVEAAPPGAVYRLRKLARRHKGKVAAAAAVVLALLIGLIATTAFAAKARREAKRADAQTTAAVEQRDLARSAATRASAAETSALAAKEATDHQSYIAAIRGAATAARAGDTEAALRQLDAAPQRYRGWEWHWLRNTTDQAVSTVAVENVYGGTLSPDGRRATFKRSGDDAALLVDAATGAQLAALPVHDPDGEGFTSFSPDGSRFAASGDDGKVLVVDARYGTPVSTAVGPGETVVVIQFSADAKRFVVLSNFHVRLCETETGAELWRLEAPGEGDERVFRCCSLSPDGRRVAVGSARGELTVWDVTLNKVVWSLPAPSDPEVGGMFNVEFSPDGVHLVTFQNPNTISVWDAGTGEVLFGSGDYNNGWTVFSGDGRRMVVFNEHVAVFDLTERRVVFETPSSDRSAGIAISGSGDRLLLITRKGEMVLWDVESGGKLATFQGRPDDASWNVGVAFCEGSGEIRSVEKGGGPIRTWDVGTGQPNLYQDISVGGEDSFSAAAVSADGERLAVGTQQGLIHLYDTRDWRKIITFTADNGNYIADLAFDATGDQLVLRPSTWVKISRFLQGESKVFYYREDDKWMNGIAVNRFDNTLYIGSNTGNILRIDLNAENLQAQKFATCSSSISGLCAKPDGSRLAVMQDKAHFLMLDAHTGALLATREGDGVAADFSPAAEDLALDRQVLPISLDQPIARFTGSAWNQVRYGSDGRRLFSLAFGSFGFKVWDPLPGGSTETVLHVDDDSRWFFRALTPLPDGKRIVALAPGSTLRVWDNATTAEKIARRREGEAARREAEPVVAKLLGPSGDQSVRGVFPLIAAAKADATLRPLVQTQAVNLLLGEAERRQRAMMAVVAAVQASRALVH